ncbi:MAG: metallophosphoesterase [Myxococcaceae bacterium]|nr:metallophosphoesterase [Myxococcaceae bacterium]
MTLPPRAPPRRRVGLYVLLALVALVGSAAIVMRASLREPFLAAPSPRASTLERSPTPLLRVLVFGDFGANGRRQAAVARALVEEHRARPFDFGILLGDNLYPCGPELELPGAMDCAFGADGNTVAPGYQPPEDPQFQQLFHAPLAGLTLPNGEPLPIHAVLGNHDIGFSASCMEGGRLLPRTVQAKACLEVAHRGPGWNMPARHFVVDTPAARFILFDSNAIAIDDYAFSFDQELAFVKEALAGCGERRCFLASHHTSVTAGRHRPEPLNAVYKERVGRLEAAGRVDAWLAGHDHDLQHTRTAKGYDVFVSGSAAKPRIEWFGSEPAPGARLFFGSTSAGFAVLELFPTGWSMRFHDEHRAPLYCCEAHGQGRCEPVACPRQ